MPNSMNILRPTVPGNTSYGGPPHPGNNNIISSCCPFYYLFWTLSFISFYCLVYIGATSQGLASSDEMCRMRLSSVPDRVS